MSLNLGIVASSRSSAPSVSLLLDTYPGAAAAYSLRKLRTAYTGAAIRVRRSSDNTETDIGFSGGQLDTTALTTFVGAGNGSVVTWYDQSGNGRNLGVSGGSVSPNIVSSGTIQLFGTRPSLYFSGSHMSNNTFTISQPNTYFIATQGTATNNTLYRHIQESTSGGGSSRNSIGKTDTGFYFLYGGDLPISATAYNTNKSILTALFNTTSSYMYYNATAILSNVNVGSQSMLGLSIGGFSPTQNNWEGWIPEYIAYNSNQSANITGIQSNINSYYSIYWQGTSNALLDLYPSASAAYSLRNLSSTYLGPLIRVRRSSDNAEQDIFGTFAGQLDTASLLAFCGAGNGFISIWYDQSGKGFNATQSTTTNQPQIVSSGVTILNNSKPSVQFNGTSQTMSQAINFTGGNYYTFTSALSANVQTGYRGIFAIQFASSFGFTAYSNLATANKWGGYQVYTTPNEQPANSSFQGAGMTLVGMQGFANQSANSSLFYKNNASDGTYNNSVGQIGHIGGLASASQHLSGKISEIVVWNYLVVGSAPNISGINSNMNSYYTIY